MLEDSHRKPKEGRRLMQRTYKFRLYPTKEEQKNIHFSLERCRLLYNRLLAERIAAYKQTGQSLTYYEQKADVAREKTTYTGTQKCPFPSPSKCRRAVGQGVSGLFPSRQKRRESGLSEIQA